MLLSFGIWFSLCGDEPPSVRTRSPHAGSPRPPEMSAADPRELRSRVAGDRRGGAAGAAPRAQGETWSLSQEWPRSEWRVSSTTNRSKTLEVIEQVRAAA